MAEPGGTLRCQHDPQECSNCMQGLLTLLRTLDNIEERTGRVPTMPIVLLLFGCESAWQPAPLA